MNIKENSHEISKQGLKFIQEHPEMLDKVKAFEQYFSVGSDLNEAKDLFEFLTQDICLWTTGTTSCDYHYEVESDEFKPSKVSAHYYEYNGQLAVSMEVEWEGDDVIAYGDCKPVNWHDYECKEKRITIRAHADLDMQCPDDLEDYSSYIIDGEDDIEYYEV